MSTPFRKSKRTARSPPLPVSPTPTPPTTPSVLRVKSVAEQKSEKKKKEEKKKMDAQLKVLVKQREAVRGKLLRVRAALRDSEEEPNPNVRNAHFLQLQKRALEKIYGECNDVQNKIYNLPLSEDQDTVQIEKYVEFEGVFNDVSLKLSTLIDVVPKAEPAAPVVGPPALQPIQPYLPPLQVPFPKFDGSYEKWYAFKALFTTLMNRYQQEEPALKLYHLRDCLIGQAQGIIDDEMINNNDYDAAWALLTLRYEDKRFVVDRLIENLFGLPKVSQEDAADLWKLIDICTKSVEALKNQVLPVAGLGEQMLVNLVVGKLDLKLQAAWEAKQTKNVLPNYATLLEFLQEQNRILERVQERGSQCCKSIEGLTLVSQTEDQRDSSGGSKMANESSTSYEDGQKNY